MTDKFGLSRFCSVFPLHPVVVVALLLFGVITVLNSPGESWFRSGWLAAFVWDVSLRVTFATHPVFPF